MSLRALALTAFGLGCLKPAPGTWGSTPPPALALVLVLVLGTGGLTPVDRRIIDLALLLTAALFSAVCVAWGGWGEQRWGGKDPGRIVADEVAGQALALLALPWQPMRGPDGWIGDAVIRDLVLAAVAFLAFRLLDIVKPPPAYQVQRLPAGWGILVDDLVAGAYALAVTQLVARVLL